MVGQPTDRPDRERYNGSASGRSGAVPSRRHRFVVGRCDYYQDSRWKSHLVERQRHEYLRLRSKRDDRPVDHTHHSAGAARRRTADSGTAGAGRAASALRDRSYCQGRPARRHFADRFAPNQRIGKGGGGIEDRARHYCDQASGSGTAAGAARIRARRTRDDARRVDRRDCSRSEPTAHRTGEQRQCLFALARR